MMIYLHWYYMTTKQTISKFTAWKTGIEMLMWGCWNWRRGIRWLISPTSSASSTAASPVDSGWCEMEWANFYSTILTELIELFLSRESSIIRNRIRLKKIANFLLSQLEMVKHLAKILKKVFTVVRVRSKHNNHVFKVMMSSSWCHSSHGNVFLFN